MSSGRVGSRRRTAATVRGLFVPHPWWFAGGLVAVGLGAIPRPAGALTWRPGLDFGARFEDLRTPTAAARDTVAGTAAPRLELRGGSERLGGSLSAQRQYLFPLTRGGGSQRLAPRPASDRAEFHASAGGPRAETLFLDGRYLRTADDFQLELPGSVRGDVARWGGVAGGDLSRADGMCRIDGWSYGAGPVRDAIGIASRASLFPWRGLRDAWVTSFRHQVLQIDRAYLIRSYMVSTGYRRFLTPATWAQVELGAAKVQMGDTTSAVGPALVLELGGPTTPLGAVTTSVTFRQELPTAMSAGIARALSWGRIALRWESLLDPLGGRPGNGAPYSNASRRASIEVQDTLSRAMVVELSASRTRSRPFGCVGPEADVQRASAWLVRRVRPWLTARGGYSYLRQANRGLDGAAPYHRVRLDLAMTVQR